MKQKIQFSDFLKNNILTNLKVNETKTKGFYFVNRLNLESNCYEKELYRIDLKTMKSEAVDLDIRPDDFVFCKDQVVLKVNCDKETKFFLFDDEKKELAFLRSVPYQVKNFRFCQNNLYFTAVLKCLKIEDTIRSGSEAPFYQEGIGHIAHKRTCLFKAEGEEARVTRLTETTFDIEDIVFDIENGRIIFTGVSRTEMKPVASDFYTYNLYTNKLNRWTTGNFRIGHVESLNKDTLVFYGIDLSKGSRNDNQQLYSLDAKTGKYESLGPKLEVSNEMPGIVTDSSFSTSRPVKVVDENFYFLTVERYRKALNKIDIKGNLKTFNCELQSIDAYEILEDGLLLIGAEELGLHEIYYLKDEDLKQVTKFNSWIINERLLSKPEYLKVENEDGIEIDGWVIPPTDYKKGQAYPGILHIHGGPKMIYGTVYFHQMQLLAAKGYFVFYANPKGSDGRGDDFANIRGHYGDYAYKDLMAFTDEVIRTYPELDENSLGVTGVSYGGYMTNYIITRTDRFKAAISESGISNMMTAFTTSDIGYHYIYEYMGNDKTPWSDKNVYMKASPIYYANKVKTPTLFVHGEQDYRCHHIESFQMYTALKYNGVTTRLCIFQDENHGIVVTGKPKTKRIRYIELLNWFNKHLKKEQIDGLD